MIEAKKKARVWSVRQLAQELGCTGNAVRQAIRAGRLPAQHIPAAPDSTGYYVIQDEDAQAHIERVRSRNEKWNAKKEEQEAE